MNHTESTLLRSGIAKPDLFSGDLETLARGRAAVPANDRVADDYLTDILQPYKAACRFLKRFEAIYPESEDAGFLARGRGQFAIPGPWYIEDTGHFNAVDSIICFNQIGYMTVASALQDGRISSKAISSSTEEFKRRMLPDMLITKISLKFVRPMQNARFSGTFDIGRIRTTPGSVIAKVAAEFRDEGDGLAQLEGLVALTPR